MTLDQTEALADIIDADTIAQHRQAMARLDMPLSQTTNHWRQELISMMANLEAVLDFADEDIPDDLVDDVASRLARMRDDIGRLLNDANRGEIIRDGISVALIGRPNAGKSTLLNALVGRPEAIISPEAGTTRDVIQVTLNISGYAVHLKDTAGLRISDSAVEKEGIRRASETARSANIVVMLIDANEADKMAVKKALMAEAGLNEASSRPYLMPIITKCDLLDDKASTPDWPNHWTAIAAKTGEGLDEWHEALKPIMAELVGDTGEAAMISRQRHRQALASCYDSLGQAQEVSLRLYPELLAEDLRHAATALGRISGHIDVEDILDDIFSSFCIGK
jgi:tRNA modification GTPase